MKIRVQTQMLRPGDVVGSQETIISISAGVRTPSGKVEVILEKNGRRRMSIWGKRTFINAERGEAT